MRAIVGWICVASVALAGCSVILSFEVTSACGDGILQEGEECDDGLPAADGDGCDIFCRVETGWSCSGLPSQCAGVCGDGTTVGDEVCDDGNTLDGDECSSDCSTSAVCTDGTCIEQPAPPWLGPVVMEMGSAATPLAACPPAFPDLRVELKDGLVAPGDCQCECGDPQSVNACGPATLYSYGSVFQFCSLAVRTQVATYADACGQGGYSPGSVNLYGLTAEALSGGFCQESTVDTIGQPAFSERIRLCGRDAPFLRGDCAAGSVCAPDTGAEYRAKCIYLAGDNACPGGPYTERHVFYNDFTDDRRCDTCTCGGVTGTCGGTVYWKSSCAVISIPGDSISHGQCKHLDVDPLNDDYIEYSPNPSGSCTPSPGQVLGRATPTQPYTVCCLPPP